MAVKSSFKNMTICLFAICIVCSSLLAGVYALTKAPIDAAASIGAFVRAYTPARSDEHTIQIAKRQIVMFLNDDFTAIAYALPYFLAWHTLLMSGTTEFMIRIANDIPSGYAPK